MPEAISTHTTTRPDPRAAEVEGLRLRAAAGSDRPPTTAHIRNALERSLDRILAAAGAGDVPSRVQFRLLRCADELTALIAQFPRPRTSAAGAALDAAAYEARRLRRRYYR